MNEKKTTLAILRVFVNEREKKTSMKTKNQKLVLLLFHICYYSIHNTITWFCYWKTIMPILSIYSKPTYPPTPRPLSAKLLHIEDIIDDKSKSSIFNSLILNPPFYQKKSAQNKHCQPTQQQSSLIFEFQFSM